MFYAVEYHVSREDVTRILEAVQQGDARATDQLFPIVYQELHELAARQMAQERAGHTLQATALVNEAYLRLVGSSDKRPHWETRGHFFSAAAEAMRRILVEHARRRMSQKRGGQEQQRVCLEAIELADPGGCEELVEVDTALSKLEKVDPNAARLVKLRYFSGLAQSDAAKVLGISSRSADRLWAYARAWLHREIRSQRESTIMRGP